MIRARDALNGLAYWLDGQQCYLDGDGTTLEAKITRCGDMIFFQRPRRGCEEQQSLSHREFSDRGRSLWEIASGPVAALHLSPYPRQTPVHGEEPQS